MTGRQLTVFEHILLGLMCTAPASGYDLKRKFASTPMGVYQPSSGALYPALRRLEATGLIRAQSGHAGQSARHRRVYEPTPAGRSAHASWLSAPVEPASVGRDLGLHLMRFVMMEHVLSRADVLAFLHNLANALGAFVVQLEHYAASGDLGDRYPQLALDHGLAVHRASLRWANQTIRALSAPG
ncbi:MAG: PadR family transcriptional regulator [Nocardiopsaceae bacterium]|jgi:DNA-binding PadR family transcriptional regulator|nr:PadR family transcriptional regulator [Nocardiopsaceae bacterium]